MPTFEHGQVQSYDIAKSFSTFVREGIIDVVLGKNISMKEGKVVEREGESVRAHLLDLNTCSFRKAKNFSMVRRRR